MPRDSQKEPLFNAVNYQFASLRELATHKEIKTRDGYVFPTIHSRIPEIHMPMPPKR